MKVIHAELYPEPIREVKRVVNGIKIHALLAQPYIEGAAAEMVQLRHEEGLLDFLMSDTGTYGSNVTSNKPQQRSWFEEYCQYHRLFGHYFDLVPAFDEDFHDPELNQTLLERMRVKIVAPSDPVDPEADERRRETARKIMPVVHSQEDAFDEFRYYHELGYTYQAIGSKPEPDQDQIDAIQEYRYRHGIKVHLFGKCAFYEIRDFAPDSVDTANYAMSVAYNSALMLYWRTDDPSEPSLIEVTYQSDTHPKANAEIYDDARHGEYLRRAGFNFSYDELVSDITKRHEVNIYSMWLMEQWLTDVWAEQHHAMYVTTA